MAGGLVAAAGAAGLAGAVRSGRLPARQVGPFRLGNPQARETWSCECGARYRSTGAGRHQVHWPADAPEEEPLLDDRCPSCGRTLGAPGQ